MKYYPGYQHPIEFSEVGYSGTALGTENSLYDEIGTSTNSNGVKHGITLLEIQ